MRFQTIDRCDDPACQCNDKQGVILYDGDSREDAEEAKRRAAYPDPTIEEVADPPVCPVCEGKPDDDSVVGGCWKCRGMSATP